MSETYLDPRFAKRSRQPGLDLLRAAAIIIVVIYHCGIFGFRLPGRIHRFGWIGVDLFFVLSGYLIGGQLVSPLTRGDRPKLARFFLRRILRILPAYFFVLAIYLFLPSWREYPEMSPPWQFVVSLQNIGMHGGTAFSHAWSLAIEDQFYFVLPFLILAFARWPRLSVIIPPIILVGGLALRYALALKNPGVEGGVSYSGFQTWIYYPTWTRLDPLMFGVLLAAVQNFRWRCWREIVQRASWLWPLGLTLIVFALWLGEGQILSVAAVVWQFPIIALGMALLLVGVINSSVAHHQIPGAAAIASIAYSVYLSHKLVIHFISQLCVHFQWALTSFKAIAILQIAIYFFGAILFLAIERPFLLLRRKMTKNI